MASVSIHDPENYERLSNVLLSELRKVKIPRIQKGHQRHEGRDAGKYVSQRGDVIGMIGEARTVNFGYGMIRHRGYGPYVANTKYKGVYEAICDFAEALLPPSFEFNTITLNHNIQAKKHTDIYNCGDSIIVGIGEYEGGKLRTYSSDTDFIAHDIRHKPLKFDGYKIPHETEPFSGERYTLIFFKTGKPGMLPQPSRVLTDKARAVEEAYWQRVRAHAEAKKAKETTKESE